jgi:hypothetical protein
MPARYRFQTAAMKLRGLDQRPSDQEAFLNPLGVKNARPKAIREYAVMVGTPAALTRELKATAEGSMVHNSRAENTCMTIMALRGSFFSETWEIQPEKGSTPSRATAQIKREEATPATAVFWVALD